MKASKRKRLEARAWKVGSAQEFLGLTDAENALVELRLSLAERLRALRQRRALTQVELAKHLGSSQSRVAKMEVGDTSVSIDLLLRALLQLGTTRQELGRLISHAA
jgi:ribosome-binding protein aMBF1 (putative translation factor)